MKKQLKFKEEIMKQVSIGIDNCLDQAHLHELDISRTEENFNGASFESADFRVLLEILVPVEVESDIHHCKDVNGKNIMRIACRLQGDNRINLPKDKV